MFWERSANPLDIHVGDVLQVKKPHPCGGNRFLVLRVGMDFRIRCEKCGHEVMLPRARIEKNIKKVERAEEETAFSKPTKPVEPKKD